MEEGRTTQLFVPQQRLKDSTRLGREEKGEAKGEKHLSSTPSFKPAPLKRRKNIGGPT